MPSNAHLIAVTLLLSASSAYTLPKRTSGTCILSSDNSNNSIAFPFTLTGVHRRSGELTRSLPLFSTSTPLFTPGLELSVVATPIVSTFTLNNGILSTSDNVPCYIYEDAVTESDAHIVCSSDPRLLNPIGNVLAGTSWATGRQCLDSNTEIVTLVPVYSNGVRHLKPFYVDETGDQLLKYCDGPCIAAGALTSVRLQIVRVENF